MLMSFTTKMMLLRLALNPHSPVPWKLILATRREPAYTDSAMARKDATKAESLRAIVPTKVPSRLSAQQRLPTDRSKVQAATALKLEELIH